MPQKNGKILRLNFRLELFTEFPVDSETFVSVRGRKSFGQSEFFLSWHEPRRDLKVLLWCKREKLKCVCLVQVQPFAQFFVFFVFFFFFCFFSARFPPAGLSATHFHADWLPMIGARQPGWLSSWYFLLLLIQLRKYLNTMRARRNQPIQWPSWVVVAVNLWSVMSTLIGGPSSSGL